MHVAGKSVLNLIQQQLHDREECIPFGQDLEVATRIQEEYCYVCPDLNKEFAKAAPVVQEYNSD